ncbi:AfsR/SARP family transcriptional regulator [Arthrobacter sp. ERGS1:01]|uniref:AfsR/SARP family transcriptional regulator n=1 Tax=Arthrobacter sp. ERGS1:01 TaxID=1704044 RepID=UPI001ED99781|nr:BTAD domain-containing putative transcriptional regulator [Arthrobacter sp. ERGS1:01]
MGAVRTFVGELRRILEPERPARTPPANLITMGDGYALNLTLTAVDLWRVERAVQTADGMSLGTRESLLTVALEEWRGVAFEEFGTRLWAQSERVRIAELRAGVAEHLAETRLALGRPKDVVTLLNDHIGEHPWREEGWRLLALALYRSARQGDALGVLSQARATLRQELGLDPSDRLAELEHGILRRDPSLELADDGETILSQTVAALSGARSQLESVTALLPLLAVSGSVQFADEQRLAAIAAAEQFGDPELTARVIGGFAVPGCWTRSDDPERSAAIVDAALRTIAALPSGTSDRVRATLLATVAMESRGTANRHAEAVEAERIARRLVDPALLCFALSALYLQEFETAGRAGTRESIGSEIIALAMDADLPTFEIQGRLIRMQALCARDNVIAASDEAGRIDLLAARFDRPLASVLTAWFRWVFTDGPAPPGGSEMPGFRIGLRELTRLSDAVRAGTALPDGHFGPYESWVRPLLLARGGRREDAMAALDTLPDPPHDLMLEVSWSLIGLAAIDCGHGAAGRRAFDALRPAAGERAAGSGAVDLGAISALLTDLARLHATKDQG